MADEEDLRRGLELISMERLDAQSKEDTVKVLRGAKEAAIFREKKIEVSQYRT